MFDTFTSYWSSRTEREQWLLFFLGLFLTVIILFFLVVKPQYEAKQQLQTQLKTKQAALSWMNASAKKITEGGGALVQNRDDKRVLASRVSIVLQQKNISSAKIKSDQRNQVSVDIAEAPFVELQQALFELENQWGVQIKSVNAKKIKDKLGMVLVKIILIRG